MFKQKIREKKSLWLMKKNDMNSRLVNKHNLTIVFIGNPFLDEAS